MSNKSINFFRELGAAEPLYPLLANNKQKYGFIDQNGEWLCPPLFEDAWAFERGRAPVKTNGKWGLLDYRGEWIAQPEYDGFNHHGDGPAMVRVSAKYGFFDEQSRRMLIDPQFSHAFGFSCELSQVIYGTSVNKSRYGYVTMGGEILMPSILGKASSFYDDRALARLTDNSKVGYIDKSRLLESKMDLFAVPPKFEDGRIFSEGLAGVKLDNKWGVIDLSGNWVIEPNYDTGIRFFDGISSASKNGIIGFIDKQGEWIFVLEGADSVSDCSENIISAVVYGPGREDENWGYMSLSGDWIIEPRFMVAKPFYRGLGEIRQHDGKNGIVDRTGAWVVKPIYDNVDIYSDLIRVHFGERQGYISRRGEPLTFDESEVC